MSSCEIRSAGERDLKFLDEIRQMIEEENRNSLMAFKSSGELALEIKNGQAALLFVDARLVGYCSYKIWKTCVEIMSLVVKPSQRGRGFGYQLFEFAAKAALNRFPDKKLLSLLNKNSVGIARRAGFKEFYKLAMPLELRESCAGCLEEKDFPNCHCQTLSLTRDGEWRIKALAADNEDDVMELAEFYCEVWKEPPWNENFWQAEEVADKIRNDLRANNSLWLLAKINGEIIGFALGHEISSEKFFEMTRQTHCAEFGGGRIFYHAELAIKKDFRLQGIGSELMRVLETFAVSSGCLFAVVRTKSVGAMKILENLNFQKTTVEHPGDPERKYWIKQHNALNSEK